MEKKKEKHVKNTVCPFCGEMFGGTGIRNHMITKHRDKLGLPEVSKGISTAEIFNKGKEKAETLGMDFKPIENMMTKMMQMRMASDMMKDMFPSSNNNGHNSEVESLRKQLENEKLVRLREAINDVKKSNANELLNSRLAELLIKQSSGGDLQKLLAETAIANMTQSPRSAVDQVGEVIKFQQALATLNPTHEKTGSETAAELIQNVTKAIAPAINEGAKRLPFLKDKGNPGLTQEQINAYKKIQEQRNHNNQVASSEENPSQGPEGILPTVTSGPMEKKPKEWKDDEAQMQYSVSPERPEVMKTSGHGVEHDISGHQVYTDYLAELNNQNLHDFKHDKIGGKT